MISNNYPCLTNSPKPTMNGENSNEIELESSVLYVVSPLPVLSCPCHLLILSFPTRLWCALMVINVLIKLLTFRLI